MQLNLVPREWDCSEHIAQLHKGIWLPLFAPNGKRLRGIHGKRGVRGIKGDGTFIGADFIRMGAGTRFPLHTHEGDHELYVISGMGYVHIDGQDIAVRAGSLIHIPGEYPHGVWVGENDGPMVFCAVGHPHHHVHARERMRLVEGDDGDQSGGVASGV
jgi:mannose-6-phosphate isomerase-like protein (cupin superfamily)